MISDIEGDIIGSIFVFYNVSTEDFGNLFVSRSVYTDDTVLTVATAEVIMNGGTYAEEYLKFAEMNPQRGYGGNFADMVSRGSLIPYDSYGTIKKSTPVIWENYQEIFDTVKILKKLAPRYGVNCYHNSNVCHCCFRP